MNGWHGPTSWDPFRDFQREMGRLFQTVGPPQPGRIPRGVPPINLYDVGNQYVLTSPLPGMGPDEVKLSITGEALTIRGERKHPEGVVEESYRRQERVFGRWTRTVTLPERVESSGIAATFADGLLTVTIPKAEKIQTRQINVTSVVAPSPPREV